MQPPSEPRIYRIVVEGELDPGWSSWLNGLTLAPDDCLAPATTLIGPVRDQAALRSILTRLWNLNLTLVSVNRIEEQSVGGTNER